MLASEQKSVEIYEPDTGLIAAGVHGTPSCNGFFFFFFFEVTHFCVGYTGISCCWSWMRGGGGSGMAIILLVLQSNSDNAYPLGNMIKVLNTRSTQ